MPTSHARAKGVTASVSELRLDSEQSEISVSRIIKPTKKSQISNIRENLSEKYSLPRAVSSIDTFSIQSLQDQSKDYKLPQISVPYRNEEIWRTETSSDRKIIVSKKPQRDWELSSTNSNFENWIFNVPNRKQRRCPASSSYSTIYEKPQKTVPKKRDVGSSQKMIDSKHAPSGSSRNFRGPKWDAPCKESFVAGAPRPYLGTCPPNVEKLTNYSKGRQKFFITQDPRKKYCLTNPQVLHSKAHSKKKEFEILTSMVKNADNICEGDEPQDEEPFVCEVIDLENPLNLDFQGLDYKKTYQKDEQELQKLRLYRRVRRHQDFRAYTKGIGQVIQDEMKKALISIPEYFDINDRSTAPKIPSDSSIKQRFLVRSEDKPFNKQREEEECAKRKAKYRDLCKQKIERNEKEKKEKQKAAAVAKERLALDVATNAFENKVKSIDRAIQRSFKLERQFKRVDVQRRVFPHTLREIKYFKQVARKENRMRHDAALVKKEFYLERFNKEKFYPALEAEVDTVSDLSHVPTISEQSSDDEDDIEVGLRDDKYKLRGFHFRLNDKIRGKRHQSEIRRTTHSQKKCITREEWLTQMFPEREKVKVDKEEGIVKVKSPDDPEFKLFHEKICPQQRPNKTSAIHQYVQSRLGLHYDRVLRKNIKIVKPRLKYPIKKFNLIGYMYREFQETIEKLKAAELAVSKNTKQTIEQYIEMKDRIRKHEKEKKKRKRMKILGIPCNKIERSSIERLCEHSESSEDEDWVPKPEWECEAEEAAARASDAARASAAVRASAAALALKTRESKKDSMLKNASIVSTAELSETSNSSTRLTAGGSQRPSRIPIPITMRGNMPAPKYRETTLRIHPRRPRDYAGERVDDEHFAEAVNTSGVPYMQTLEPDKHLYENVRTKKKPYTTMFEGRRHHDHWIPTQNKFVNVHYKPRVVEPKLEKVKSEEDQKIMEYFRMANPPCNAFINMNLTLSKADTNAMIAEHKKTKKRHSIAMKAMRSDDKCATRDFVFHSRPPEDFENLDYPGRRDFLQLLEEVKATFNEMRDKNNGEDKLCINREDLIKELEEDLISIESCLTSLESSQCTNFSNDSGSFLLMENQWKVPLDYVRKSLVPFTELQRSRFAAKVIDADTEDANPFKMLPFSGQRKQQLRLAEHADSFFTYNTRLQNGIRMRLEVPVEDIRKKLIGAGNEKHPCLVVTDFDERFVDDMKDRPPIKMFNFKTGVSILKSALRLKFESLLIQGQIVRTKIYDRLNEQNFENMVKIKDLFEKLFAKWKKREYDDAMNVVNQVKKFYEMSDRLKELYRSTERKTMMLNMDIVFLEGRWIRRIMLQNFHYLLADQDWRVKHDWIHQKEESSSELLTDSSEQYSDDISSKWSSNDQYREYELETFEESIKKRTTANIRKRDKDDAWAIKAFYEEFYLKNKQPILIAFDSSDSFLKGIEKLKVKTFVSLLELHLVLGVHSELQAKLETFEEWCIRDLKEKSYYVERKCSKKYVMENCATYLENRFIQFMDKPVEHSFTDEEFLQQRAIIFEVWKAVVPPTRRGSGGINTEPTDMVAMITDMALDLIAKFDQIPLKKRHEIEIQLREDRAHEAKISRSAYQIERRIETEMKKVLKNLEPPYKKQRRTGKLPRLLIIKKEREVQKKEIEISDFTKFFFSAFHADDEVLTASNARKSVSTLDNIKENKIPFYFDHFLRLNGYKPNYNFTTNVSARDGPEIDRFRKTELIPDVLEKMKIFEKNQQIIQDLNISRNPQMYDDVW